MEKTTQQKTGQASHKVFVQQLYRDYQEICYQHRLTLPAVVIQLRPLASKWGEWNGATRCISLSEKLVEAHPWHVVVEILKHEMAHQVVQELWGQEESHGPYFQLACEKLGMAAWARKASITEMDSRLDTIGDTNPISPVVRRIQKLLQLSGSSNSHEAAAALQKAKELSQSYQVEAQAASAHTEFHVRLINHRRRRMESFHTRLAAILVEHFHVETIFVSIFDPLSSTTVKAMEIVGSAHHVEIAEYVYWFLFQQLPSLWLQEAPQGQMRHRMSFYLGVLQGFSEKLRKEQKISTIKEHSLLVISQEQTQRALACRFPRLRTQKTRSTISDAAAYRHGCKKGSDLQLRAGIQKKSTACGGFLTEGKR